jgi:integrase/recombinase XerC
MNEMKENHSVIEQENIGPGKRNAVNKHLGSKKLANKTMAMIDKHRMAGKLKPDDTSVRLDEGETPLPGPAPEFPGQDGSRWDGALEKTARVIAQYLADNHGRLAEGTRRHHRYALEKFFNSCQKDFNQIEKADIRNFVDELKRMGCKNSTINSYLGALKSFYSYCIEEDLVAKNPAQPFRFLHVDDPIPHYLVSDELEEFKEVASGCLLERTIVETLNATGVRAGELCGIKKEDINWDEKAIAILGKGWMSGRTVYFHAGCAARLKQYLASRNDDSPYLFVNKLGEPLKTATLDTYFHKLSQKLNFQVTPRMLRHTFAAHMAQKGMPLMILSEILGHRNIQSTMMCIRISTADTRNEYLKCL